VAGKPVKDGRDLQKIVAGLPVGEQAAVEVQRDGKPVNVTLTIEQQPEEFGARAVPALEPPQRARTEGVTVEKAGLKLVDLTPALGRQLGYGDDLTGALVSEVTSGSAADVAGLMRGTLIEKVDGTSVSSAADASAALAQANLKDGAALRVRTPINGVDYVVLRAIE
jgi:serine protease Do